LTTNSSKVFVVDLSPEGTKILFETDRDGNDEIYIMDIEGENQKNITNNASKDGHPTFSPDGSQVVFIWLLLTEGFFI